MNRSLNISVSKEDVFLEVGRVTNYVGKKDGTEGAFESIATIEANDSMLERFWNEGCENVTNILRHYLSSEPTNGERYEATCTMTHNWNFNLESSINCDVLSYLIQYITSKWMRFVKQSDEKLYLNDADELLASIGNKLLVRVRPHRHRFTLEDDSNPPYTNFG